MGDPDENRRGSVAALSEQKRIAVTEKQPGPNAT